MPAVVAAAAARFDGHVVDPLRTGVVVVGLVALQSGVNLVNDYFDDASGLDADPDFADSPFPLGSRVIQQGLLSREAVKRGAVVCFGLGAACGLVLDTVHAGHVVLWLGLVGFALGYAYTAPPLRIAYRGAGEPITFALFGPVAGLGAYYVLTGTVSAAAIVVSCVVGALAMAILFLHHFPQRAADARHGKRTPVVRLGAVRAGRLVPWILAAPYALVVGSVAVGLLGPGALAFVLTAPLAWRVGRTACARPGHDRAMAGAAFRTLGIHFFGSLLLAAGVAVRS
jgi:1,4-dihydroxy-2-naphthoate octaprenyltransferase